MQAARDRSSLAQLTAQHLCIHIFTPALKLCQKLSRHFGLFLGQIVLLPDIFLQVEKLLGVVLEIFDQFLIPFKDDPDRPIHLSGGPKGERCRCHTNSSF